ncbi:MAG: elongation factor G [Planctomycetes bacterium]|nr:elongation factor G [Planctomycetota bacterium]
MAKYQTQDIRNFVLVGHGSSGKTALADALLFKGKAVNRLGSIEDGTSVFDFEPEEKERRNSIDLACAAVNVLGRELNVLDAPGYSDFSGEAVSGLNAVETAVVCINAAAGIMVNTRKMWEQAKKVGVGRVVAINKLDQDNVHFAKLVASVRETFGRECVPVFLPAGEGPSLRGVANILEKAAPDEYKALADEAKEKLMEIDDELLMKYLDGRTVAPEELAKALPGAIASGRVVPILCTSVKKDVGIAETLDFIAKYFPSPLGVPSRKGIGPEKGEEIVRPADGPLAGQVFKSIADPFVQRLAYVRVYSGTLANDQPLFNQRIGKGGRIGGMFKPFGKEQRATTSAIAGDIVCVTKVDDLNTCDTICDPANLVKFAPLQFPTPMVSLAVEPKTKQDLARLSESLQKMAGSDPTFRFERDRQTAELVISGMSRLHLDVALARLKRKFDVQVSTKPPRIAFKETVMAVADGHHKHKKQSGGHGQYGEVYLSVKPTARGQGFVFTDSISQGRIPQQYIPAIEKGVRETMERGVVSGNIVVDVEVEVTDGSYHEVDSGPESFKLAGSKAFKEAFVKARPVLLEPIVNIEISVPARFMGDITSDLNSRRGRIQGMDSAGELQIIRATIPMMEIMDYETQLRSVTGGEGSYSIELAGYEPLPSRLAEGIIAKTAKHDEEEE